MDKKNPPEKGVNQRVVAPARKEESADALNDILVCYN
jgi:hypothetical protein